MAQGWVVECDACGMSFEAWDEGNPWYRGPVVLEVVEPGSPAPKAKKQYHYHPVSDHRWQQHFDSGNDVKHLCLDCGRKFYWDVSLLGDDDQDRPPCIKCSGGNVYAVYALAGKSCPKCQDGTFREDPRSIMIS